MKWSVSLPGSPPSINHYYIRTHHGVAKNRDVERYQVMVSLLVKASKPSKWTWSGGQIRVNFDFILKREIDTDNAKKAINDAIAVALGVNDKFFLGCDRSKVVNGKEKDPRVIIEIDDGT